LPGVCQQSGELTLPFGASLVQPSRGWTTAGKLLIDHRECGLRSVQIAL
jgi:hypothetical protein